MFRKSEKRQKDYKNFEKFNWILYRHRASQSICTPKILEEDFNRSPRFISLPTIVYLKNKSRAFSARTRLLKRKVLENLLSELIFKQNINSRLLQKKVSYILGQANQDKI